MNHYTICQQLFRSHHLLMRVGQFVILSSIICLLIVTSPRTQAQVGDTSSFFPPIPIGYDPDNRTTSSIAWGDVDNDGDLDLAVGNWNEINELYLNEEGTLYLDTTWQPESDYTKSVAWGDMDNDGDLDLAVGNYGVNKLYLNQAGTLMLDPAWQPESNRTKSLAWGDVDNDGDLDLAVGNDDDVNKLYLNQGGTLVLDTRWQPELDDTWSIAWGDVDTDADLDLIVGNNGVNKLYLNQEGKLTLDTSWQPESDYTESVAWGDVDNDGDLDLAVGNDDDVNKLYLNQRGTLILNTRWQPGVDRTMSVAWGDVDNDGDLDLAVGISNGVNKLYLNQEGTLTPDTTWQSESESTMSVAWGDVDNDGDLDLAVGNGRDVNKLYLNKGKTLTLDTSWQPETENTMSVAWGDVDNDGDLDLAVGNYGDANKLYLNRSGTLTLDTSWRPISDTTESVAWGDVDNDGDLDLAVGNHGDANKLYLNRSGTLILDTSWQPESDDTWSVAWGDVDNDGDLDLAVGNDGINKLYLNQEGRLTHDTSWQPKSDYTISVAWGDVDDDGDLDLVVGNGRDVNKLYLNQGGTLTLDTSWRPTPGYTRSVAWGDVDNDGDLDLAVGNWGGINKLYLNQGGTLTLNRAWEPESDATTLVAWGDVDNDGDLDLAVGNTGANKLYLNEGGELQSDISWQPVWENTTSMAWGDVDNDGDLDLAVGISSGVNKLYLNRYWRNQNSTNLSIQLKPPHQEDNRRIRFPYTVKSRMGLPLRRLNVAYTIDGYTDWQAAIATTDTITTMVSTGILSGTIPLMNRVQTAAIAHSSPSLKEQFFLPFIKTSGTDASASSLTRAVNRLRVNPTVGEHEYDWDLARTGLVGNLDQVIVRFTAYPACLNSCQYAKDVAYTAPLRVRGMTVRVMQQTDSGLVPGANAIIHRAPAGTDQFAPLINDSGEPLRTNRAGYLIGHPQIFTGDRLVALLSVKKRDELTTSPSISQTNVYTHYYHTSAPITNEGQLDSQEIRFFQDQTLTVSANNQLLLFNLRVGLEWDARHDTVFQDQLRRDLQRTSEILYDLTNGQAALGSIDIFHDKGFWNQVDVAVTARNTQRPSAVLGGWVQTPTQEVDVDGRPIVYLPGQIRMPPRYTKYGDKSQSADNDDWAQVLARELGHYLFRLLDNYLGIKNDAVTIIDCPGSMMTNPFLPEYSEFLSSEQWTQEVGCQNSLAALKLSRSDWEGIEAAVPILRNRGENPGPQHLVLPVTKIRFWNPTWAPNTVKEMQFLLKDADGTLLRLPVSTGQAYLLTKRSAPDATDRSQDEREIEYLVDLGRPQGDNLLAQGASVGDRLCVFDTSRKTLRSGCTTVDEQTRTLELTGVQDWHPNVQVTSVNTRTVEVVVTGIAEEQLQIQLYPAVGTASTPVDMTKTDGTFSATVIASQGAYYGHVRICAPACLMRSDGGEVREFIVEFANKFDWDGQAFDWNSPMFNWEEKAFDRTNQAFDWAAPALGWGAQGFAWGVPVMSSDGQVQVIPLENTFDINTHYLLQRIDFLSTLPHWLTPVGHAYRIDADMPPTNASILFRYLESDVPPRSEDELAIYFSPDNGLTWQRLSTKVAKVWNLALTRMGGTGIYVLTTSQPMSPLQPGCNLPMGYPMQTNRPIGEALASLDGAYTSVYLEDPTAPSGWRLYDTTVRSAFTQIVNTLTSTRLGDAYRIFATEPIIPYLPIDSEGDITIQAGSLQMQDHVIVPPATYYGWITPTAYFTPTVGMQVTAEMNGTVYATTTIVELEGKLAYVLMVKPEFIHQCGTSNHQIIFRVGPWVMSHNRTWDNRQAWFHSLSISSSIPLIPSTPTPTPTSIQMVPSTPTPIATTPDLINPSIQKRMWLPFMVKR
ncbi:VCBS repeat-containing protein [Chloroflexi bacterium TSY]|nr:VCBS repeat-containing protein [Chloroflexi bacterium TSY]